MNAEAALGQQQKESTEQAIRHYQETAVREFPRLCRELFDLVRGIFEGVDGVRIEGGNIKQSLDRFDGQKVVGFAEVEVPACAVSFNGRRIMFRPAGVNLVGVAGKIDVQTDRQNPFVKNGIYMIRRRGESGIWQLALADEQNHFTPLDRAMLERIFEDYFVS
jgi:hypothetical protein